MKERELVLKKRFMKMYAATNIGVLLPGKMSRVI